MKVAVAVGLFAAFAHGAAPNGLVGRTNAPNGIVVDVRCDGDDGLTQRLCDATKRAFASSEDFTLSDGKQGDTLIVEIPTNVGWKKVQGRMRVFYAVELSAKDAKRSGLHRGSCSDAELGRCAAQIVSWARRTISHR